MSTTPQSSTRRRPGGRSERIRNEVFAVALGLLENSAVSDLSVRRIAHDAGVAETTVYRRWGSLEGVLSGALEHLAGSENPIPDTGTLDGDLDALLRNVVGILERPGVRRIFRFALSLDDASPEGARLRDEFWQTRFGAGTSIVQRATDRGEIPPQDDGQRIIETLVGVAYVRAFLLDRPITESVIADAVRSAMCVARPE